MSPSRVISQVSSQIGSPSQVSIVIIFVLCCRNLIGFSFDSLLIFS